MSSAKDVRKAKNRRESGTFVAIPHAVLDHSNYTKLSAYGVKLLFDLCSQIRFKKSAETNNGDLCAAWSMMEKRGWKSRDTLAKSKRELLHFGFIEITQAGGRKFPTLYAVTWWAIGHLPGKDHIQATRIPSGKWKDEHGHFDPRMKNPQHGGRVNGSIINTVGVSMAGNDASIDTAGVSKTGVLADSLTRPPWTFLESPYLPEKIQQPYSLVIRQGKAMPVHIKSKQGSWLDVWSILIPSRKNTSAMECAA